MDFELSLNSEKIGAAYPVEPLAVTPETSLRDVLLLMKTQKSGSVLICKEGILAGIFTERDALRLMAEEATLDQPISAVMSPNVKTITADATVSEVIHKMAVGRYRRLTIVDDANQPIGLAGAHGIVHYLVDHFPEAIYNLPPGPRTAAAEREGA